MAFSTRRGRPPRPQSDGHDLGTPELCYKRAHGLTHEPIDRVLHHGLMTTSQHWCGLHLRWLYTLRYGAPVVTTRYTDAMGSFGPSEEDPQWRSMREQEYRDATSLLKTVKRYEPVMRLCVFNETPAFLNPQFRAQAWNDPAIANQLNGHLTMLLEGLTLLESQWKPKHSRHGQNHDIK